MIKTSVIFPARNEELLIKDCLLDIYRHLNRKKYPFEILVVVNGCIDNTEKIINNQIKKYKGIQMLKSKAGYGFALRKGIKSARGNFIVIFNVDFYDLHLLDLIDIDLYGKDFVIGSKMAPWSEDNRSFIRRCISYTFNLYLKLVHGFRGSDTHGIKVFKREVSTRVLKDCKTTSGIFDTEFTLRAQKAGFKIADFPVCVFEKRSPRFGHRLLQTPRDIAELYLALRS